MARRLWTKTAALPNDNGGNARGGYIRTAKADDMMKSAINSPIRCASSIPPASNNSSPQRSRKGR
jgi:hypothetical protein